MRVIVLSLVVSVSLFISGCNQQKPDKPPPLLSPIEEDLVTKGLVDVQTLDSSIQVELKYSRTDNFLKKDAYGDLERCYLQKEVTEKLANAQKYLHGIKPSYSLLVYDCVRPRRIQRMMWEIVKGTEQQIYVANPDTGSIHNYGSAVDLTIVDDSGMPLDMGCAFDYFGRLAQPRYEKEFLKSGRLTQQHIDNRELLRSVMIKAGFLPILSEWWHYNGFPKNEVKTRYSIVE